MVSAAQGMPYHLILIHSYKERLQGDWASVPVMLLNEPAYTGELGLVRSTLRSMAKAQEAAASGYRCFME